MRRPEVWLGMTFVVGLLLGGAISEDDTRVEFIEIPRTKVVEGPAPPPIETVVVPESCIKAVALSRDIVDSARGLYRSGEEQVAIVQDGRLFLAAKRNMSEIEERQRKLFGDTTGYIYDLEVTFARYEKARKQCESEQ